MSESDAPVCGFCDRPESVCHEPVDYRFPMAAQKAYARHGRTTAPTCKAGQLADMEGVRIPQGTAVVLTGQIGWNWDRARFHSGWSGAAPSTAERLGFGFSLEGRR